jgi:hypothetical protein
VTILTNIKALQLIGSSTSKGFGIHPEKSYFSLLRGRWPALVASTVSKDLLTMSQIVDILRQAPDKTCETVLVIHSAADTFLIPSLPFRLYLRMRAGTSTSSDHGPGYVIYKSMNRLVKVLFFSVGLLKPNTSFISLFRSLKSIEALSINYRHIFVIVDTSTRLFSLEWMFKGLYSSFTNILLKKSPKLSVIDFDKISYDSGYVRADFYQKDRWHLNELGHDLLFNEIDLKLIDLYSIS